MSLMEGNIIVYLQNSKGLSENLLLKNSVGWIKKNHMQRSLASYYRMEEIVPFKK